MYSYFVLDIGFILLAASLICNGISQINAKNLLKIIVLLLLLTTVFDQILIMLSIVKYHAGQLLGVYIGKAPVEDFAYSLVAAVIMPVLWKRANRKPKSHEK
jgi:lycopene cyclase domain-containing protein